jgi:RimJ/RimL family protein N-acetyltransferase/nucleoside-diphosphate-sugar epimerase
MPRGIVLGGNGQVGSAAALALARAGWQVTSTGQKQTRFPPGLRDAGVRFSRSDRYNAEDLRQLLGEGADVVVDCVGYTAAHARMLLAYQDILGSLVFISSKAVYVDDHGRHANSAEPAEFAGPVTEQQPTLAPSDIDYQSPEGYGRNKVAAERVLLDSGLPVSVLRPSRIHGIGAARPREWVFVKRVLDGRPHVLLAHGGRGINHPTAAVNLAALITFCAARPAARILNSADPDAPDGLAISRIIAAQLAHTWREVLLDATAPDHLGDHPWNTLPPFVLDTSAAERLGFVPVGNYAETVEAEVDWLVKAAQAGDPRCVLPPPDEPYFRPFFDYAREDAWLAKRIDSAGKQLPVVALRPVEDSDLDSLFDQMREPESVWMAAFTPADPDDRQAFDLHMAQVRAAPEITMRAITCDGELVGSTASFVVDGLAEVTYWIARRAWGRGIATKALALLLELVLVRPLHARAASDNVGSLRVLQKLGFQIVGTETSFAPGRSAEIEETILRLDP